MSTPLLFRIFDRIRKACRGLHQTPCFRRRPRRRYACQQLEDRILPAAANTFAVISGVVHHDLAGDGRTAEDVPQSGVPVTLFRDGGDGTFDAGLADDFEVGTRMSDINGYYEFSDLRSGKYFVRMTSPAGYIQRTLNNPVSVVITDG